MNTTFLLNGGAGRIIAAIPALQMYAKHNKDDDFKVIIQGWSEIYQNHPLLHQRTFNYADRGIFDLIVKNSNIVYPEPYYNKNYYNQQNHMVDVFDQIINENYNCDNEGILKKINEPYLHVSKQEEFQIRGLISNIKQETKKDTMVVFQPYGSGIKMEEGRPFDPSYRSFDVDSALEIIKMLSEKYTVIYFGPDEFRHPGDQYSVDLSKITNKNIRFYMNLIKECDHFVGVDSVGNHIANAFMKKKTLVLGSTFAENVAYQENSIVFASNTPPVYSPLRICESSYSDEINSRCMDHPIETLEQIARSVDALL